MNFYSLALLCFVFASAAFGAQKPNAGARIIQARGEVFINNYPAREGSVALNGQTIETRMGKCTIAFAGQHIVHLDIDSQIKVNLDETGDQIQLDFPYGSARALIRNQGDKKPFFKVRTQSAVMGVRGTHIYVNQPKEAGSLPQFVTVEGLAEVTALNRNGAAPISLGTNQSTQGSPTSSGITPVITLPAAEVKEMAGRVAPPPPRMRTEGEVRRYYEQKVTIGDLKRDLPPPPPPPPGQFINLDPLADAFRGVNVGTVIRKD